MAFDSLNLDFNPTFGYSKFYYFHSMSLFQNSVANKYLKGLEKKKLDEAWVKFEAHFLNPAIQNNIRESKEEQYQGEFHII